MKKITTTSAKQTKELGKLLARELRGGEVLCLDGELGAGKTTFTQGLLQGLKVKGPYTSPTFVIMKHYELATHTSQLVTQNAKKRRATRYELRDIYHIDAYRIKSDDLLELGWKEIVTDKKNVVIIEWSDRVKKILPQKSLKITFTWLDKNKRQISFS